MKGRDFPNNDSIVFFSKRIYSTFNYDRHYIKYNREVLSTHLNNKNGYTGW